MLLFNKFKKKSKEYFISIGAGFNQLPLINEAKNQGYLIIGVDQDTSAIGFSKIDIKIQESITNHIEIFKKIQELLLDGKIKGVLSRSYGDAIKTTAYLAEKLNIPYIPFSAIENLIDKYKMKKILKKNNILTPKFTIFNLKNLKKYKFPFVLKPVTGHAKQSVQMIENDKKIKIYLKKTKKNFKKIIVENYIDGDEIIALGIIVNQKFHLIEITDKIVSKLPYFVDFKHTTPSIYLSMWDKISEIGQKISHSFNIINSPLLIEFRIDDNKNLYVLETAAEFGGEFLSDILIPQRTGYNIIKQTILAISGKNFNQPVYKNKYPSFVVKYITNNKKGKLISFTPIDNKKIKNLVFYKIFKNIGSNITKPISNHDRIGVVITKGNTLEMASDTAEQAILELNIRIK